MNLLPFELIMRYFKYRNQDGKSRFLKLQSKIWNLTKFRSAYYGFINTVLDIFLKEKKIKWKFEFF